MFFYFHILPNDIQREIFEILVFNGFYIKEIEINRLQFKLLKDLRLVNKNFRQLSLKYWQQKIEINNFEDYLLKLKYFNFEISECIYVSNLYLSYDIHKILIFFSIIPSKVRSLEIIGLIKSHLIQYLPSTIKTLIFNFWVLGNDIVYKFDVCYLPKTVEFFLYKGVEGTIIGEYNNPNILLSTFNLIKEYYMTPFLKICERNYKDKNLKLKLLKNELKKGANINYKYGYGTSLTLVCSYNNDLSLVEFLIENGADINCEKFLDKTFKTPLFEAMFTENFTMVNYLIKKGARMDQKYLSEINIMSRAILSKKYKLINFLLNHGFSINSKPKYYYNSFLCMVLQQPENILELLLLNGANPNNFNPLIQATKNNNLYSINLLIKYGSNINQENDEGKTPLFYISKNMNFLENTLPILELLIKNGANVNHKDKKGNTILFLLSKIYVKNSIYFSIIDLLIKNGAK